MKSELYWHNFLGVTTLWLALTGMGIFFVVLITHLASLDVNEPPGLICIKGIEYFSDTLTPVIDAHSLNPLLCR